MSEIWPFYIFKFLLLKFQSLKMKKKWPYILLILARIEKNKITIFSPTLKVRVNKVVLLFLLWSI